MKFRLVVCVLCACTGLAGHLVSAQPAAARIADLGAAFPAVRNVATAAEFAVYRWALDGGATMYQINTANGKVLAAVVVGGGQAISDLKIGTSPVAILGVGSDAQVTSNGALSSAKVMGADATSTCPCTTTKIYEDANIVVYVVTDSQGNVISSIIIRKGVKT